MTKLIDTRVKHSTEGNMDLVGFDTDEGAVDLTRFEDGAISLEVGFEEASPDEVDAILDDMEGSEHFPADALETARGMVADSREGKTVAEMGVDTDDEDADDGPGFEEGDVVHVCDDGTKIRVGDKINHPGGWSYRITGKDGEHTLTKMDNTDDWGVIVSTAERDVEENGFAERVGEGV